MLLAYAKLSLYDDLLESAVPDDPYLGARAGPLFPEGDRRAIPRRARASPPAPRDHRHPARQFDDQSRRPVADRAHRRPDRRRAGGHRRGLRRGARQLRHDRAQRRDRRARQQDFRQAAARSLRRRAGSAARPHRLVPAQRRSGARACRSRRRIIATASPRSKPRWTRCCRTRLCGARERAQAGTRDAPACPTRWPAASPILRPLAAAPDIVLVADRTGKPVERGGGDLFRRRRRYSGSTASPGGRASITVADYFDRLALDRARDLDRRCRTPANGRHGAERRGRRQRGRSLGRAAQRRGRATSAARSGEIVTFRA